MTLIVEKTHQATESHRAYLTYAMSKRRDALRTVVEGLRSTRFTLETSRAAALGAFAGEC